MQASQFLEGLEPGATSHADAAVSGTIDDLLLKASQQLERSSEEPVQQDTTQVEASQLLQGLEPETTAAIDDLLLQASQQFQWSFVVFWHVWFGHLWFLSIKFHHITCF